MLDFYNRLFQLATLNVINLYAQSSQTSPKYRVTNWLDNKKAAVSITFDDNCDGQFTYALPSMNSRMKLIPQEEMFSL